MPNVFAYVMLMIWPVACIIMFRRLPLERAMIWCILGGYLVLPPLANFDLPLVPAMDKYSIPNISAFVICAFVLKRKISFWPRSVLARVLVVLMVASVIPTVANNADPLLFMVMANSEPISFVVDQLPGLGIRDLFSVLVAQVIVLLPFFMARQYLGSETGLRELLLALAIGGLIYSIPSLIEIRLSPQINTWVYGFFQHDFAQTIRQGGFRPIVFLPHGLWLAFFMATALFSLAALSRNAQGITRLRYLLATVYLAGVLVLCKSLASLAYGIAFTPVVLLASPRMQIRLAVLLAMVAIIYPMLRNTGLVPIDAIMAQAEAFSPERAQSLGYRFGNEEQLLERAHEKPWFGWGQWGRNLVRHTETGEILTIPDGRWIIVFGTFGWVGYLAEMGLLALPLLLLGRRVSQNKPLSPYVAPVAIILAATILDMLLNATLIPITWMCAGAILGYVEQSHNPRGNVGKRRLFGEGPAIGRAKPKDDKALRSHL
ncbi:MAG: hypothetical protein L3J36_12695 [Rhodobacteraceae bacterium]|nr:hypothetical protein [Paracoccaceae bacterium]